MFLERRCGQRELVERTSILARALLLCVVLAPAIAIAQVAPTGTHYAGRPSDTGHIGPNAQGGYSTSIALDLPPSRGGLPIPVQIISGTKGFGAAGVGWDVPLSFVLVDKSFGHRRPVRIFDKAPTPRDRITVSLPGRQLEMIQQGTQWVARTEPDILMKEDGGNWIVYDGAGLTYTFKQPTILAGTGGPYAGRAGLWLLDTIRGPGNATVALTHEVQHVNEPGEAIPAISIDLVRVKYNPHPSAGCYKHEVGLLYGNAVQGSTRKSLSIMGERVVARYRKIDAVEVLSRESCTSALQRLRLYELRYHVDADAQQERLFSVKMLGRQGTSEAGVSVPMAEYAYGHATSPASGGRDVLRYDTSMTPTKVELPQGANVIADSYRVGTAIFASPITSSSKPYIAGSSLVDMTGDGRPDLVFRKTNQLWISRNVASPSGMADFAPPVLLTDAVLTKPIMDARSSDTDRFHDGQIVVTREYVWRQSIDVNGDGRIDIVDASEQSKRWMIYLNTPDAGASGVKWIKREIDVSPIYDRLAAAGMAVESGYVPLSRRYTGRDHEEWMCWRWNPDLDRYAIFPIGLPPPAGIGLGGPECQGVGEGELYAGPEKTYTEWELTDINGDGYPDFVFNSSPVDIILNKEPPWVTQHNGQLHRLEKLLIEVRPTGHANGRANDVQALLNVVGVFLSPPTGGSRGFSSAIDLIVGDDCGVGQWSGNTDQLGTVSNLACGFMDVNGDGIPDRVVSSRAQLGTGYGFETTSIAMPSALKQHSYHHHYYQGCPKPGTPQDPNNPDPASFAFQNAAIRDVTGDAIPDFIERKSTGYKVYVGTGAGFAGASLGDGTFYPGAALDVEGGFGISQVDDACSGEWSRTTSGLYDLNGDGKPEFVALSNVGSWHLKTYPLIGGSVPGNPEAGKLVEVKNGYGAVTQISYRSAKQDATTKHSVPFAEIVVGKISTVSTNQPALGTPPAPTHYAYGNIELIYEPALDRFRSTGYLRRVELVSTEITGLPELQVTANVTDHYGLPAFSPQMTAEERFARYQLVGRVSSVSTLIGARVNSDPWALLTVNLAITTLRVASTQYDLKARWFTEQPAPWFVDCLDIMLPYDFDTSVTLNGSQYNPCTAHGFVYPKVTTSWRGTAGPPSSNNVQTRTSVRDIDTLGRVTSMYLENDVARGDDDVCVDTAFATPTGSNERVLSAVASRKVWGGPSCSRYHRSDAVYGQEAFEYDKLPHGLVSSNGHVTARTVYRHAADTGQHLSTIRDFDADYDLAGNPVRFVKIRDDGAERTTKIHYDAFGLVPEHTEMAGTNVPTMHTYQSFDAVSLDTLDATDANGTIRGTRFDGFGRIELETLDTPSAPEGVMARYRYYGFDGADADGRRVEMKSFTNPVAKAAVESTEGRESTTFLDELGRPRFSHVDLGADYSNEKMIAGARTYDPLGRVSFEAEPHSTSQPFNTAYGTTRYFAPDGSLSLVIRGHGWQPYNTTPDDSVARYPTVFTHTFVNNAEVSAAQAADALTSGSAQFGVKRESVTSAIGRVLSRSTWQNSTRLEHAQFGYDALGHQTRVTRYQNPGVPSNPVQSSTRFDSLDQVIAITEPLNAPQERHFSSFGELTKVTWTPAAPEPKHSIVNRYDAFGRLTSTFEEHDGVSDTATERQYTYDVAGASPIIDPTYVLGRLASASAKSGDVVFSYDALGNVNGRSFIDAQSDVYVDQQGFHADGTAAWVELNLPDNAFKSERVEYEYDTAGRLRWMWFSDGANTEELYNASKMDPWGRLIAGSFGRQLQYSAKYEPNGRRLIRDVQLLSPSGNRDVSFVAYDALGRELRRTEKGAGTTDITVAYDSLGRLSSSAGTQRGNPVSWAFGYDALGNALGLADQIGAADATLSYLATDRDRICRVGYGNGGLGGTACNVAYDSFGSITSYPTPNGIVEVDYFTAGDVKKIKNQSGAEAAFGYDPFGALQEVHVTEPSGEYRLDRHYGEFTTIRAQRGPAGKAHFISRRFPGPGLSISRRGTTGPWIFQFDDTRGTRFTTDHDGKFVQDLDYTPYGQTTSTGAAAGSVEFSTEQWNGGDALEPFGIVKLGARLYDPRIGRFLSRDPLLIPRTAATTNPYAFAFNDPINFADPSGLDPDACMGMCWLGTTYNPDQPSDYSWAMALGSAAAFYLWATGRDRPDQPSLNRREELLAFGAGFDLAHAQIQTYQLQAHVAEADNARYRSFIGDSGRRYGAAFPITVGQGRYIVEAGKAGLVAAQCALGPPACANAVIDYALDKVSELLPGDGDQLLPLPRLPTSPGGFVRSVTDSRIGNLSPTSPRRFANLSPDDPGQVVKRMVLTNENGKWVVKTGTGRTYSASGEYLFVTKNGTVYVTRRPAQGGVTHADLANGDAVDFAGMIKFGGRNNRGTLIRWDNASGHYKPPAAYAEQANLPMAAFQSKVYYRSN